MPLKPTRRSVLAAAPALVGLSAKTDRPIAGSFVNDAFPLGHKLRDHTPFRAPARVEHVPVVIAGGGVAGLSAAWRMQKHGFHDFVLLEMEPQAGGNARWGENDITRYPWAAHYVPVPPRSNALLRELFEDLGVLRNGTWDERTLCFTPQERLYIHGRWQEGIEPEFGVSQTHRAQYRRFLDRVKEFRASGEFTIPLEIGAKPSPLDTLSIAAWMKQNGFDSPYLRWYMDYCCRDDYGASAEATSAWAGIHYFAAREPDEKGPLTWPEGNGWIVRQLLARLGGHVRTNAPVYRIAREGTRLHVYTEATLYIADAVVFAAPSFIAPYIVDGAAPPVGFVYSPWLTANITLERMPDERNSEPAWDNVVYGSPTLGYVDARHMSVASVRQRTVWTFYWALAEYRPADGRRLLLARDWGTWRDAILADLERVHPDIRSCVSRIDMMRHGHAMIRPVPGFLARTPARFASARIFAANSDLGGISIFEEAQYHGVRAADAALHAMGSANSERK